MTRCEHRDDPQGRPTLALSAEALFLVGALRAWTAARRPGEDQGAGWRQIFALAEMPAEAGLAFDRFLAAVVRGLRRPLDIRCRPCPQVGADEEALLRILGALQAGDRLGAIDDLAGWLVPEAVIPALGAGQHLAGLLARHDVPLPWSPLPAPAAWHALGHAAGPH